MKLFQRTESKMFGNLMTTWFLTVEWKYQDLWIGAFWKTGKYNLDFDLWICIIPCFPIHLRMFKEFQRNRTRLIQAP